MKSLSILFLALGPIWTLQAKPCDQPLVLNDVRIEQVQIVQKSDFLTVMFKAAEDSSIVWESLLSRKKSDGAVFQTLIERMKNNDSVNVELCVTSNGFEVARVGLSK